MNDKINLVVTDISPLKHSIFEKTCGNYKISTIEMVNISNVDEKLFHQVHNVDRGGTGHRFLQALDIVLMDLSAKIKDSKDRIVIKKVRRFKYKSGIINHKRTWIMPGEDTEIFLIGPGGHTKVMLKDVIEDY